MTSVFEGQTCSIVEDFLDDFDDIVLPREGSSAPVVRVLDTDRSVIAEVIATPEASVRGGWRADIPIPFMDLVDSTTLVARWVFEGVDDVYKAKTTITVNPASSGRDEDIVIVCGRDTRMQLELPIKYKPPVPDKPADMKNAKRAVPGKPGDELTLSLYYNNGAVFENWNVEEPDIKVQALHSKTLVDIPAIMGTAQMYPLSLLVDHKPHKGRNSTLSYKVWAITPQIVLAARELEDFINKARLKNVIPELEYTQSDIMEYLSRGLSMFNALQPNVTHFTGTNMQGHLLDAWLTCSSIYALGAQIQAEGSLGFDFGGQTVSLNIDRTPALESALGRLDAQIEGVVKPYKKLLGRAGVLGGDGSQGGKMIDGSRAIGRLGLSNTPMTRVPGSMGRFGSNFIRSVF